MAAVDINRVAKLRALGREQEAIDLLGALNMIQRGCGLPEFAMPEPAKTLPDGLYTADARTTTGAQFMAALAEPELFTDVTVKALPSGGYRAEAA